MKTFLSFAILFFSISAFAQSNFQTEWQKIDSLVSLGQKQSALEIVAGIYDQSKTTSQTDQFVKASLYRMKLEADFQEDYFEKAIERTQLEIQTSKTPVKQILHSILAELYWKYYEENRWKIHNRSETSNFENTDLKTWDLKKIVATCMDNYDLSLSEKEILKRTKLTNFSAILNKQENSETFRPSLFDLLAHRAIDFYSSSDAGLTKPAQTFSMNRADFFSSSEVFDTISLASPDEFSFEFHSLQLLQEVVNFHLNDTEPDALIDAELKRLEFVYEKCTLPEKDSLYLLSLSQLEKKYQNHPASAEISYKIANQLNNDNHDEIIPFSGYSENLKNKWNKKLAAEICGKAIARFPDSFGAKNCWALLEQIKQPTLSITTDYASMIGKPALALVEYKNFPNVYFRLLKINPDSNQLILEMEMDKRLVKYLSIPALKSWKQTLPDDGDFCQHSAEIKLPALPSGYYILLASSDSTFADKQGIVTSNGFWKSNISYISKRNNNNNETEILLLDRETGQALSGVKVQPFYQEYNSYARKTETKAGEIVQSDRSGFVRIPSRMVNKNFGARYFIVFQTKNDRLITENYFYENNHQITEPPAYTQSYFFTDRAIYRPGQTVYFKGIILEKQGEKVKIKPKFKSEVSLKDVNYKEISKLTLTSNDYGSFSGSFVLPQNGLTGNMSITGVNGSVSFRVEEYKRPKFEVEFEPVKGSYKLGETISAKGKSTAYSGSTVSDAKVKYRIVRQVQYPYFWRNWGRMPRLGNMEISNGETTTGNDGTFEVSFEAIPDLSVDRKTNPMFSYTIYADVTDLNGESHSAETSISVGYTALLVKTDVPDEINLEKDLQFSLSTTNLNGEKEAASGEIKIYKLRQPAGVLFSRKWEKPDRFTMTESEFKKYFPEEIYSHEDDVSTWEKEKIVFSASFQTPADSIIKPGNSLPTGTFILEIKTIDAFGSEVVYQKQFNTFQPQSNKTSTVLPLSATLLTPKAEPGESVKILIDSPMKNANVIFELTQNNNLIRREFIRLNKEQKLISIPVKDEYRGNFTINLSIVRNNRLLQDDKQIVVPFSNKKLDIQFATFRNKLLPGQDEEWQITIRDHEGEKVAAEMLAGMYDASLDAFIPHTWPFQLYYPNYGSRNWNDIQCFRVNSNFQYHSPEVLYSFQSRQYDQLNWFGFGERYYGGLKRGNIMIRGTAVHNQLMIADSETIEFEAQDDAPPITRMQLATQADEVSTVVYGSATRKKLASSVTVVEDSPDQKPAEPKAIQIRKNLNETAFFFPQLTTNEKGEIVIKFKAPEALTRWKMMGLAYTKELQIGEIEKTLVTQKDLMIFTNAPRFLREGDSMDFAAKVSNISTRDLSGTAELHFFDALTMQPIDNLLGLNPTTIPFAVGKGGSTPVSWKIKIPEGLQAVTYRITASSGTFSDGEEAAIPVLSNRMLITESMPLPINGMQTKQFEFKKLVNSGNSGSSLRNYRLTLEYTSNPAWYALQALPYLMEFPYDCAEQTFSKYYANSLATHLANSDPKIKRVFESWKTSSPDALKSNLEKNEELKSVLLQESPWVREATNESERKQRIGLLFDLNRMASEQNSAIKKLIDLQNPNGGWPWFAGMPESRYITQHIVSGLGHLENLKVLNTNANNDITQMLSKAINYLDETLQLDFEKLKKNDKEYLKNNHLGYGDIQYLYARSYFMCEFPIDNKYLEMLDYYKTQSAKYWTSQNNYLKGMMALYLKRFENQSTAALIMRSLKETALHNEEMGMYWRNNPSGWYWYQAPIETQALLIEAFDEVSNDQKAVDEMKIWLLKQKQTQDWKTTKATAEAVYALLLRGSSLLASDKQVEISLGNEKVDANKQDGSKPEAGTGYFKTSWPASEIKSEMGKVTVSNPNPTVAWGAMYWQYFEQLDKITPAQTPLSLNKKLFREMNSPTGPVIEPITENSSLKIGDKIVVRIELRTDRDMEYIHLKDMRASAFEPVNVLSGYRFQDGLGYYESTRDASTNFFISWLPKGTYVFEYKLTATQKGEFSNGITSVQGMYAPEFAAHSEGIRITVK